MNVDFDKIYLEIMMGLFIILALSLPLLFTYELIKGNPAYDKACKNLVKNSEFVNGDIDRCKSNNEVVAVEMVCTNYDLIHWATPNCKAIPISTKEFSR